MNIDAGTLMSVQAWSLYRRDHARRLAAHRRARVVELGPHMRLQFEDELTVRWHIQEILRIERIDGLQDMRTEVERCAHLCPDGTDWVATLMIEIPDAGLRNLNLPDLTRAAHRMFVRVDAPPRARVYAQANADLPDRHLTRESAVHFLRFKWPEAARVALAHGAGAVLGCAHPRYAFVRTIPPAVAAMLRRDLTVAAWRLPPPGHGEHAAHSQVGALSAAS